MIKHLLSAPLTFLKDNEGNQSSKRFWGNRTLSFWVVLKIILYFAVLICPLVSHHQFPKATFEMCNEIANMFGYSGLALLFGGLAERFKFMRK